VAEQVAGAAQQRHAEVGRRGPAATTGPKGPAGARTGAGRCRAARLRTDRPVLIVSRWPFPSYTFPTEGVMALTDSDGGEKCSTRTPVIAVDLDRFSPICGKRWGP